jgi:hypothetical protein
MGFEVAHTRRTYLQLDILSCEGGQGVGLGGNLKGAPRTQRRRDGLRTYAQTDSLKIT